MAMPVNPATASASPAWSSSSSPVAQLNRPIDSIPHQILNSPFVQALSAATAIAGLAGVTVVALVFGAPLGIAIPLAVTTGVATIALVIFVYKKKDVIWFDFSLLYVKIACVGSRQLNKRLSPKIHRHRWYNAIPSSHEGPHRLYLGALPLANKRHHQKICQLPGRDRPAVLTVTEPFENNRTGLLGDPVRSSDWRHLGVRHEQMCVYDMRGLTIEQLARGAEYIHENIEAGRSVYVHCKAGRGRSLLMVAAYLMTHERALVEGQPGGNLAEKALNLVRTVRPQIHISATQKRSLAQFAETL